MDYLEVNHDTGMAAEVEHMHRLGAAIYRVILRDLDSDNVVSVRFFPHSMFDAAKHYARQVVNPAEIVGDVISVRII